MNKFFTVFLTFAAVSLTCSCEENTRLNSATVPAERVESIEMKSATIPAERVEKLEITANSSDIDYEKKELVFIGNVEVKDPQVEIKADRLAVFFDENEDVKSFKAYGNDDLVEVILYRENESPINAKGDEASYNAKTGQITLTGETTSLKNGKNSIKGAKKIVFFMTKEGITDFKTTGRSKFTIDRKSGLLNKGTGDDK